MNPSPGGANKESEGSSPTASSALEVARGSEKAEEGKAEGGDVEVAEKAEDPMDEDTVTPTAVFCIRLKQPRSNLMRKMTVPELCRNFRNAFQFPRSLDL